MCAVPARGRPGRLEAAEEVVGHRFKDISLLERALTHPSSAEEPAAQDYERLEFLGDAVLGFIVVDEVYRRFPELAEGVMTKIKISVVSGTSLTETAERLGIGPLLLMGESERGTGGRGLSSALENAYEALVAAIFLDGGIRAARDFVMRTLGDGIVPEAAAGLEHPKSLLQERLQAGGAAPEYRIVRSEGPPHDRSFFAEVLAEGKLLGEGVGRSKKEAEMNAAAAALERMDPAG